jgi:hypothetical protein
MKASILSGLTALVIGLTAIRAWLDRVAAEPGYIEMHYQPAG